MKKLAFALICIGAASLTGCAPHPISREDTQIDARIKSPDGKLEAVHAEDISGGPAVGVTEEVFVVPSGNFPRLEDRVISEECIRNIALSWGSSRALNVRYDVAADYREHPQPNSGSPLTALSSGYWTFVSPHGVALHIQRHLTPADGGC